MSTRINLKVHIRDPVWNNKVTGPRLFRFGSAKTNDRQQISQLQAIVAIKCKVLPESRL